MGSFGEAVGEAPAAGRLTAEFVAGQERSGKYFDGRNGLQLRINPTGSRSWVQRVTIRGHRREIGLGGWPLVSLEEARERARSNRKVARSGGDPRFVPASTIVFEDAFEQVLAFLQPGWRNGSKSAGQWRQSIRTYAYPTLRGMPVDTIRPADVVCVLAPIWHSKEETARRVRQRIHRVLQWSRAHGYASGPNPVDAAVAALPPHHGTGRHFPAVPHGEVRDALGQVFRSGATRETKLSFGFLVMTAARGGEVRRADWDEIDLAGRTWVIPGNRTKTGREHRVPLSSGAMQLIAPVERKTGLVFPGSTGLTLSDSTHSKLMRALGMPGVPHGFRSSFRDWAAEIAIAPRELAELSLGHICYGNVEASYARSDLLNRRRPLMEEWSDYVIPKEVEEAFGAACPVEPVPEVQPEKTGVTGIAGPGQGQHPAAEEPFDRILRIGEVCRIVGLSRSAIYRMARSDGFPRSRRLSKHAVGWRLSEIRDWVETLPAG